MRVVRWHDKTDHEDSENIEDQDTPENALCGLWNISPRVLSLGGCNRDVLDARVGVDGVVERGPETHEATSSAGIIKILNEWTRVFPVSETDAFVIGSASAGDDERHDVEANDQHDLQHRTCELCFAIDLDKEKIACT